MKEYCTAKEMSEKWGISDRRIRAMCSQGKIEGAFQLGRAWAIPKDAKRPADGRIKTGKYVDWRKK
ncbi:MAG: helix-turn-helix domain-containing protein [Anaerobutyricum hallii]|uniref:helix-turn-helix domain-containing protein n=1 Tax=Anaerobutyricum hallii TaxID=39488 RepID=UPI00242C0821|nr:helix-turn-helix domain-containing protein [Anaerobutyricum hallii]MDD6587931.1 helix-turn-helix domain-containing protein [Anaerobutyricum hallii]